VGRAGEHLFVRALIEQVAHRVGCWVLSAEC
jgi:hypothetical protein